MVSATVYDLMYRWWAPWDGVGVRDDLRWLLDSGRVRLGLGTRAVDLGCGTGANVVFLAEHGVEATGVDFSHVALEKARGRAASAGVEDRCRWVQADLTDVDADLGGPFDLVVDFGTLDDLRPEGRRAMADLMARLTRPGGHALEWCFYGETSDLPRFSLTGPSRLYRGLEPGEEQELFGDAFDIEPLHVNADGALWACFLLTRR